MTSWYVDCHSRSCHPILSIELTKNQPMRKTGYLKHERSGECHLCSHRSPFAGVAGVSVWSMSTLKTSYCALVGHECFFGTSKFDLSMCRCISTTKQHDQPSSAVMITVFLYRCRKPFVTLRDLGVLNVDPTQEVPRSDRVSWGISNLTPLPIARRMGGTLAVGACGVVRRSGLRICTTAHFIAPLAMRCSA